MEREGRKFQPNLLILGTGVLLPDSRDARRASGHQSPNRECPIVVEGDFLLWIAKRYVPMLSSQDWQFTRLEALSRSVDEIIEQTLNTTHSVASIRTFTDQPTTIFNEQGRVILPERNDHFDALVSFMYAEFPGLDGILETSSTQWTGVAEAGILRKVGHGRQPEAPSRKRKLAGR